MTLNAASPSLLQRLKLRYEKNEQVFDIAAFVGGFVFDIAMLDRIDAWSTIIQQAVYLLLIAVILMRSSIAMSNTKPPTNAAMSKACSFFS